MPACRDRAGPQPTSDTPPAGVTPISTTAVTPAAAHGERQLAQLVGRQPVDARHDRRRRPPPRRARRRARSPAVTAATFTSSASARASSSLRCTPPRASPGEPTSCGDVVELVLVSLQQRHRTGAGDRLDAAQVGADRALADDLDQTDVAGRAHVRAAAQLDRRSRLEHAHDVAVLVAEEGDGALRLGVALGHLRGTDRGVGEGLGVDHRLDLRRSRRR